MVVKTEPGRVLSSWSHHQERARAMENICFCLFGLTSDIQEKSVLEYQKLCEIWLIYSNRFRNLHSAIEHHRKSIYILVSDALLELCIDHRVNTGLKETFWGGCCEEMHGGCSSSVLLLEECEVYYITYNVWSTPPHTVCISESVTYKTWLGLSESISCICNKDRICYFVFVRATRLYL